MMTRVMITIVITLLLAYIAYRIVRMIIEKIVGVISIVTERSIEFYYENEEEIKETFSSPIRSCKETIKSSVNALKGSLPGQETVTTGRKTIKQMLVRVLIIFSLWVFSLVVAVVAVASHFNFAMGMY